MKRITNNTNELMAIDPKLVYDMRINGAIERFPYMFWTDMNTIRKVTKHLLEDRLKLNRDEIADVFCVKFIIYHKLWGVMQYFSGSPYEFLNFVYPGEYKKWELKNVPVDTWDMDSAKEAMKWFIEEKLKWTDKEIRLYYSKRTFRENGMYGLLHFLDNSPFGALNLIYPGKYKPWELKNVPMHTWGDEKAAEATMWLFEEKLKWTEEEIALYATKRIFNSNRLGGLLRSYKDNMHKLLNLAYPGKYKPEDLKHLSYKKK